MNFRLKTTGEVAEILKELQSTTNLRPNLLSRIAISLSILEESIPEYVESDFNGLDFNRATLTGDQDYFYKAIITQHYGKSLPEEKYFPDLFNAHLTRGIKILSNEYKHLGNYEKLLNYLVNISITQLREV